MHHFIKEFWWDMYFPSFLQLRRSVTFYFTMALYKNGWMIQRRWNGNRILNTMSTRSLIHLKYKSLSISLLIYLKPERLHQLAHVPKWPKQPDGTKLKPGTLGSSIPNTLSFIYLLPSQELDQRADWKQISRDSNTICNWKKKWLMYVTDETET